MDQSEHEKAMRDILMIMFQRQMEAGKWLLGSLLVVNGGAILTILSQSEILRNSDGVFLVCFLFGIVFAFFAGAFSWVSSDTVITLLRVRLNLQYHDDDEKLIGLRAHRNFHSITISSMWFSSTVSIFSFVAGCYFVYSNFV